MGLPQLSNNDSEERKCKRCGKVFGYAFTKPNQKYCSSHCQKMAWKEETKAIHDSLHPVIVKTCTVCGIPFTPLKGKEDVQITCSNKCKVIRGNLMRKYRGREKFNLEIIKKQCLHCGKDFYVGKDETIEIKFCSSKCKNANHHREKRPYWSIRKQGKWEGNWAKARERDGYQCQLCGDSNSLKLIVHHKDGTGEETDKNHDLDNLTTLCGSCHNFFHRLHLVNINNQWQIKGAILDKLGLEAEVKQK